MKDLGLEPIIYWNGQNTDTFQSGYSLTEELLAKNDLPTAIWCASDLMAYGVLESLKQHGLVAGKDVC